MIAETRIEGMRVLVITDDFGDCPAAAYLQTPDGVVAFMDWVSKRYIDSAGFVEDMAKLVYNKYMDD